MAPDGACRGITLIVSPRPTSRRPPSNFFGHQDLGDRRHRAHGSASRTHLHLPGIPPSSHFSQTRPSPSTSTHGCARNHISAAKTSCPATPTTIQRPAASAGRSGWAASQSWGPSWVRGMVATSQAEEVKVELWTGLFLVSYFFFFSS